ncbi:hypothetical protein LTS18_011557 [Coniosporium uncinatum]|uniref:Uncharacterized protein n=1 Tax=Coniosporium uncinatum TaxID=93489 RepID=A0ACC3DJS8_9PEZI|nr:hypothetical protein LTS18_011557 [Coniosporium uncinatum]
MRTFIRSFSKTAGGGYQGYGRSNMIVANNPSSPHFDGTDGPPRWKSGPGSSSKGKGRAISENRVATAARKSNVTPEEEEDSILPIGTAVPYRQDPRRDDKGDGSYALETYAPSSSGEPSSSTSDTSTASASAEASASTEYRYGNALSENPTRMKMRPERVTSRTMVWRPQGQERERKGQQQ